MNRNARSDDERFEDLDESAEDSEAATDAMIAGDEGRPYTAPMYPPATPGGGAGMRLGAGFSTSDSEDDLDEGAGVSNSRATEERRPDEEITARVKRLLRTDAATSALRLEVETIDGTVYLRGEVDTLDDGDLAAEVATRVRGVEDVVDETWLHD